MAVATLVPIEEYLSTSWDPDREYVAGRLIERNVGELDHSYLQSLMAKLLWTRDGSRICRDTVETLDGSISIPLTEIFADMPSTEDQ
jgi:hypothetical protein